MSASSRAAFPRIRQLGRPPEMKLAAIALAVACLLGACDSSTPPPSPSPAGSPAALVDAVAPANGVQAPPSSGAPASSPSAAPQPTPTPDPETVREAAAAQLLVASAANSKAWQALTAKRHWSAKAEAEIRSQWVADLKKLEVPADTAADLRHLIRVTILVDALDIERADAFARKAADFDTVALRDRHATSRRADAMDRVLADLGLPPLCRSGCP